MIKKCLTCGNPTYNNKKKYCSEKCKRLMRKLRRKLYYNDETNTWELINK
jgi:predicted nucleic acid-binding Zn ribbon protein